VTRLFAAIAEMTVGEVGPRAGQIPQRRDICRSIQVLTAPRRLSSSSDRSRTSRQGSCSKPVNVTWTKHRGPPRGVYCARRLRRIGGSACFAHSIVHHSPGCEAGPPRRFDVTSIPRASRRTCCEMASSVPGPRVSSAHRSGGGPPVGIRPGTGQQSAGPHRGGLDMLGILRQLPCGSAPQGRASAAPSSRAPRGRSFLRAASSTIVGVEIASASALASPRTRSRTTNYRPILRVGRQIADRPAARQGRTRRCAYAFVTDTSVTRSSRPHCCVREGPHGAPPDSAGSAFDKAGAHARRRVSEKLECRATVKRSPAPR